MTGDEFITGTCKWCGDVGAVYPDNSLCEDCDNDVYHCVICDEDQHVDDLCRHLFRDANFEWSGSGTGAEPRDDDIRAAFFRLLDLMPCGFAVELRLAIRSGRFHTWLTAPMVGCGGLMAMHGMRGSVRWGDALMEVGEGDAAEETADGYRWLASLYDDRTSAANRVTLAWIDEWRDRAAPIARWLDDGGARSGEAVG